MHCLFHIAIVAAALAVIYWGLILGRVFLPVQKDYYTNTRALNFKPPSEVGGEKEGGGDGDGDGE